MRGSSARNQSKHILYHDYETQIQDDYTHRGQLPVD
jgi:hypothetical protein